MTATASGKARPPVVEQAASAPEAVRPTARIRPPLPVTLARADSGYLPGDPYVRRFWVAVLGPGAVTELLRLIRAGREGREEPLPQWLPSLLRSELVRVEGGRMIVADLVPPVPAALLRRLPPGLREEHRRLYERRRP
jgi:hypothetical protein